MKCKTISKGLMKSYMSKQQRKNQKMTMMKTGEYPKNMNQGMKLPPKTPLKKEKTYHSKSPEEKKQVQKVSGKRNKRKGHNAERYLAQLFREAGYSYCVTTRASSR